MSDEIENKDKRINITEAELIAADTFLDDNSVGRRLQAAEHILVHFAKERKLRRVKQFIYNMSFDLRKISDIERFKSLIKEPGTELNSLVKESLGVAEVRAAEVKDRKTIRFYLFYEAGLTDTEYQFHSQNFGQCIATILSSMQFDMSGFHRDKALRAKVSSVVENEIKKSGVQVDLSPKG